MESRKRKDYDDSNEDGDEDRFIEVNGVVFSLSDPDDEVYEGSCYGYVEAHSVECPCCKKTLIPHNYHSEFQCRRNQLRTARAGRGLPFYVVSYAISRHYGGPEEGGWYYDRLSINEVSRCFTAGQGLKAARKLKEEYPTCKRGRGSVLGGDDTYVKVCYDEGEFPVETKGRPHYE